jgi:hypothetical protein
VSSEAIQHSCPSCGRSTALTTYGPEPSLCLDCQRAYGLLGEETEGESVARIEGTDPDNPVWGTVAAIGVWVASIFALAASVFGAVLYLTYAGRLDLPIPP